MRVQRCYMRELLWEDIMHSSIWTRDTSFTGFAKPGGQAKIASLMDRSPATISRELKRSSLPKGVYKPGSADRMASSHRWQCSKRERLRLLGHHVCDRLATGWSLEPMVGRLKLERSGHTISRGSIYRFVCRPKVRLEKLHRYLPRAKASRGRGYIKRRRHPLEGPCSVHERPQTMALGEQFGHGKEALLQFRT